MTTSPNQAVAGALRAEMARHRVATRDLAERLGKSPMWVSRRMTGETEMTVTDAHAIADALGITPDALLTPTST